jgi:15-cis-phytoene synthase
VPAEPRLQVVAGELLPLGVKGRELSALEDAWLPLLDPLAWGEAQAEALKLRGRILFGLGARLLGGDSNATEPAGELWSLIDGARHCTDGASRDYLLNQARAVAVPRRVPVRLRPLTIIAAVAAANPRDPSSSLARGMAAAKHRLTGRIPQL